MIERVERYIASQDLAAPKQPLWVGVSGGMDSMVLLHVLRTIGHVCHVAHVDHGLRGAESDADLRFVKEHCSALKIPFRSIRVDVGQLTATGISVQMAARQLRYGWFKELVREGPGLLATAHHADDAVETLIMDLMQGTGPEGWGSILPRNGPFIRPLIQLERDKIEAYAKQHSIAYRNDASNTDLKYLRNRVRHNVMPFLEEIRPGVRKVMHRNVQLLRDQNSIVEEKVSEIMATLGPPKDDVLHVPFEMITGHFGRPVLHRLLGAKGFHPDRIADILQAVHSRSTGAIFDDHGTIVSVDRKELLITSSHVRMPEYVINALENAPTHLTIEITAKDRGHTNSADVNIAWFDASKVPFPWTLRPWRPGDRMRPIGLNGSKLISDILIDAKVSRNAKQQTYVLVSGDRIVWLCGHRIAEGSQGSEGSGTVLRVAWKGK